MFSFCILNSNVIAADCLGRKFFSSWSMEMVMVVLKKIASINSWWFYFLMNVSSSKQMSEYSPCMFSFLILNSNVIATDSLRRKSYHDGQWKWSWWQSDHCVK